MELITERCEIRNFTCCEEAELRALLASPAVMTYLEPPYSREKTAAFLKTCGLGPAPLIYAVWGRGNGRFLGYVIFHPWEEGAWELGWVLFPQYWGIGIARELTQALIAHARSCGIPELVLQALPEQTATAAIARHFGFRLTECRDRCRIYRLKL